MSDSEYVMGDGFGRTVDVMEIRTSLIYLREQREIINNFAKAFLDISQDTPEAFDRNKLENFYALNEWLEEIQQTLTEDGIVILTVSEE